MSSAAGSDDSAAVASADRPGVTAANFEVSRANKEFWDELCGTPFAPSLGVTDSSSESLARFDRWYLDFYPYLFEEIPFDRVASKRVLEVGLGYGTVSGRLMASGASLVGLDIAEGPVRMVEHRAKLLGGDGRGIQASILDAPFPDCSFDFVIAIGSFHHTGNTQRAVDETHRILKPGGEAVIMVYNAYSYRRWLKNTRETIRYWNVDRRGRGELESGNESARALYDINTNGAAAPHTDFCSVAAMRRICEKWSGFCFRRRNIGADSVFRHLPRNLAMRLFGASIGLDIYFRLKK